MNLPAAKTLTTDEARILLKQNPGLRATAERDDNGQICSWFFKGITSDMDHRCSDPLLFPWVAHERATWPWRFMTTKVPLEISLATSGIATKPAVPISRRLAFSEDPKFTIPAGTRMKVVMASRLGDIGLTTDLGAEHGYSVRVSIEDLYNKFENFSNEA